MTVIEMTDVKPKCRTLKMGKLSDLESRSGVKTHSLELRFEEFVFDSG